MGRGIMGRGIMGRGIMGRIVGPQPLRALTIGHLLGIVGSGWITVSLANSLFFGVSRDASHDQVLRYLLLTLLPVAALAPVIGPALDHMQSRRAQIPRYANLARAACCCGLAITLGTPAFYIAAPLILVANKAFTASKYSLIPLLVDTPGSLVATNCRIARVSAAVGAFATATGVLMNAAFAPFVVVLLAAPWFVLAAAVLSHVPNIDCPAGDQRLGGQARSHRRTRTIALPLTAMRAAVGFFAFTSAFALQRDAGAARSIAFLVVLYGVGSFAANIGASRLRRAMTEERMIWASAWPAMCLCAVAAVTPNPIAMSAAGFFLGLASSTTRHAFDSVLQTMSSDAGRGRSFARFETIIQIGWVIGAASATVMQLSAGAAFGVPAIVLAGSLVTLAVLTTSIRIRFAQGATALRTRCSDVGAAAIRWSSYQQMLPIAGRLRRRAARARS